MPTDTARREITVHAPADEVLAVLRDVESQTRWIPQILEAQVLERAADGRPRTARFAASSAVGTDRYTLSYEHDPDGLRWTMVEGRLQTGQEGHYVVRAESDRTCTVSYELTIHHNLPLPGFIRGRVITGLVKDSLEGLRDDLEHTGAG